MIHIPFSVPPGLGFDSASFNTVRFIPKIPFPAPIKPRVATSDISRRLFFSFLLPSIWRKSFPKNVRRLLKRMTLCRLRIYSFLLVLQKIVESLLILHLSEKHWRGEMEGDEKVKNDALQIIGQYEDLPRLVVFDLDYTLWPFYCDCYYEDDTPYLYPQAKGILEALKEKGIEVAIASRSPTSQIAKSFLAKLGINSMFVAQEIFSSWTHKTEHFQRIHRKTGVPFSSMLFFDDEDRNIQATSKMGVTSILVGNGVNLGALRQGLSEFSRKSGSSSRS